MIPALKSPKLQILLDHYREVGGEKRMPSRRDIDPLQLGPVLPIIWLNEYEPAAGTFRYRLGGEAVNAVSGGSVAKRLLSDFVVGERFEVVNENFLKVLREEAALVTSGPLYRCSDRIGIGERLVLPLSSDGVTADGLLGATARDTLVDVNSISMSEQKTTYVPIHELKRFDASRMAGG